MSVGSTGHNIQEQKRTKRRSALNSSTVETDVGEVENKMHNLKSK
jgi:hypothetical protein